MSDKIAIFYHLMQIKGWEFLYQDQIQALCSSGLMSACDFIHIGINGDSKLFWTPPKCNIKRNEILTSEYSTLKDLEHFANNTNENYKILYFHSKGITKYEDMNVRAWRLYMEYFLIKNWKECVDSLNEYDCVGTSFTTKSSYRTSPPQFHPRINGRMVGCVGCHPHFSGNFWWANTEYLKKLNTSYLSDLRWKQEFWITSDYEKNNPKIKNFFDTHTEGSLYLSAITPDKYIKLT